MNIAFVSIDDANDAATWSGIPYNILKALRNHGLTVNVISPLKNGFAKLLLSHRKAMAKLTQRPESLDHYPLLLKNYARQIDKAVRGTGTDVIFSTSSIPITLLKSRVPIVFWTDATFHGMVDYYSGQFSKLKLRTIERGTYQEETALHNASAAVYASSWAASGARKLTDESKIFVINFGANLESGLSQEQVWANLNRKLHTPNRPKTLLFCGVDWWRKGGDTAVEVTRRLNQQGVATRLRAVGSRPAETPPDFVELLGFLDSRTEVGRQSLYNEFLNADLFVLPTKAEAAGIVFCEAAAFGLPVVTTKTGGISDYVRDGSTGFCLPASTEVSAFTFACKQLLTDNKLYTSMCIQSFQEYKARLNWDTAAKQLEDIFSGVTAQQSHRS